MYEWMRILAVSMVCSGLAMASGPVVQWSHGGLGTLEVSPCAVDVLETPGLEVIVAGGDNGLVRCLNAHGGLVWESKTPLMSRIITPPAVSAVLRTGKRAVAVASEKGIVSCLDATSGAEVWRQELGGACAGLAWADIDGDGQDNLMVFQRDKGILVFAERNAVLWTFDGSELGRPLTLMRTGAVYDVDEDRRMEVFAADAQGVFCVDAKGKLLWQTASEVPLTGALAVAGPGQDGIPRVYCAGAGVLESFDAGVGDLLWKCPVDLITAQSQPHIALGDIDRDSMLDIVVTVPGAGIAAVGSEGKVLWVYTEIPVRSPSIVADVDADTTLEVLAGGDGNRLLLVSDEGELKTSWPVHGEVRVSPMAVDSDVDGLVDLIYVDDELRCAGLGKVYVPSLLPWPMVHATLGRVNGIGISQENEAAVLEDTRPLLENGGFEQFEGQMPMGWTPEPPVENGCAPDTETKLAGASAVRVNPFSGPVVLLSAPVPVPSELVAVTASVMGQGAGAAGVSIRWLGKQGVLREEVLKEQPDLGTGWKRFMAGNSRAPLGAHSVCMVLTASETAGAPVYWDEAQMMGVFRLIPQACVAVNQVGYELNAPKQFTAWCNFKVDEAEYEVIGTEKSHKGILESRTRITGANNSDWGYYYWRGDFSSFNEPGTYLIQVKLGAITVQSPSFSLEPDLLWRVTLPLALTCFRYHRCGADVAGSHLPCHLDDASGERSLAGGWHEGSDYSKLNTPYYTLELATAYSIVRHKLGLQTPLERMFRDEVVWGAEYLLRSAKADGSACAGLVSNPDYWGAPDQETDNQSGTGDERKPDPNGTEDPSLAAAALARVARLFGETPAYGETAARGLQWALDRDRRGPAQFSAATDLYIATHQAAYGELATALLPAPDLVWGEAIEEYDAEFDPPEPKSFHLALTLRERVQALLARADNPFGVYAPEHDGHTVFFGPPDAGGAQQEGNTRQILEAALLVARAYRYNPIPEYKKFVLNQLNWVLGNNPAGVSLMEGAGRKFLPTYYHRYAAGGLARGAVPGAVANGFTGRGPGDDRPYVDLSGAERPDAATNGIDLHNTLLYIKALCHLKRNIVLE